MTIGYFTYITGFATLIALALQFLGLFKEYKKTRDAISLVVFGVFLGALGGAISPSGIKFNISMGGFETIILVFVFVIVGSIIWAQFTTEDKIANLYGVALFATLLFTMVLGIGSMAKFTEETQLTYTTGELLHVVAYNVDKENYDKAITTLLRIKSRLPFDDIRRKDIDERIELLKNQQIKQLQ